MARAELRAHLRIPSDGFAIVTLPDGARVEARVRDISLGGAYLLAEPGAPDIPVDAVVEVYLFHQGHAAEAVTVQATILRAETAGQGFVVRFAPPSTAEASEELVAKVAREAEQQGLKAADLYIRPRPFASTAWLMKAVGRAAVLGGAVGGMRLLLDWLDVIL